MKNVAANSVLRTYIPCTKHSRPLQFIVESSSLVQLHNRYNIAVSAGLCTCIYTFRA